MLKFPKIAKTFKITANLEIKICKIWDRCRVQIKDLINNFKVKVYNFKALINNSKALINNNRA